MNFNYEMMGYIALEMEHRKNKVISIKDIDSIIFYYEQYKREHTATFVNSATDANIQNLAVDEAKIAYRTVPLNKFCLGE